MKRFSRLLIYALVPAFFGSAVAHCQPAARYSRDSVRLALADTILDTGPIDVFQGGVALWLFNDVAYRLSLTPIAGVVDFHTRMIRLNFEKHVIERSLDAKYDASVSAIKPTDPRALAQYYALEQNYLGQLDSLDRIHNAAIAGLYMRYKYKRIRVGPTVNHPLLTRSYYNSSREKKFEFLRSATLYLGDDIGAFQSELIAGYLGCARISVNSLLGREKKAEIDPARLDTLTSEQLDKLIEETDSVNTANATFNKVISGGGEIFIQAQMPLLNVNGNRKNRVFMESELVGKLSFDVPAAGSEIPGASSNVFASLSLSNRVMVPVIQFDEKEDRIEGYEGFYFYASASPAYFYGNAKFQENIGLDRQDLWAVDASAGIVFRNYLVFCNRQWFSAEHLRDASEWRIGVSLIRKIQ